MCSCKFLYFMVFPTYNTPTSALKRASETRPSAKKLKVSKGFQIKFY